MRINVDFHVHSDASPDGRDGISRLLAGAKRAQLAAIAVCDHDLCTPLPAEDGILLIPGTEISTDLGHILGLFLEQPVVLERSGGLPKARAAIDAIHAAGGIAVLAHPFQRRTADAASYLDLPFDAIEAANARAAMKVRDANARAARLAQNMQLPSTGGSDAHSAKELGSAYTELDAAACTIPALRAALLAGKGRPVLQKTCTWKRKALSQWTKARRSGSAKRQAKALCYLGAAVLRDLKKGE